MRCPGRRCRPLFVQAVLLRLQELRAVGPQLPARGDVAVKGFAGDTQFRAEGADLGFLVPMAAMARRTLAGVILYGRPPVRPRARADARPATVRSEMRERSNSARAAKIPNTSLPEAVVVSMAAPSPVRTFSPMSRSVRLWTVFTRWRRSRPNRSSFHTKRVSPAFMTFRQAASCGRSSFFPEAWSS